MTIEKLKTLHCISELKQMQLLTILAMSVRNLQPAGYILTVNRSTFLYVESSTAVLIDCSHFRSPQYEAYRCFECIPINYQDTVMYIEPMTVQLWKLISLDLVMTICRKSLQFFCKIYDLLAEKFPYYGTKTPE